MKRIEHKFNEKGVEVKWCNKHKEGKGAWLELSRFGKTEASSDRLATTCLLCVSEYRKKYHEEHPGHYKNYGKKYYNEHLEQYKKYNEKQREEHPEYCRKYSKTYYKKHPELCSLKGYKLNAKKRNLKFLITDDEFYVLIKQNCFYCGAPPSPINGVDRQDNDLDYTVTNSVSCCSQCNHAKLDGSLKDFLLWAERLHSFQKEKRSF